MMNKSQSDYMSEHQYGKSRTHKLLLFLIVILFIEFLANNRASAQSTGLKSLYSLRIQQDFNEITNASADSNLVHSSTSLIYRRIFANRLLNVGIGGTFSSHKLTYRRETESTDSTGDLIITTQKTKLNYLGEGATLRLSSHIWRMNLSTNISIAFGLEAWGIAGVAQRNPALEDPTDNRITKQKGTFTGQGCEGALHIQIKRVLISLGIVPFEKESFRIKSDKSDFTNQSVALEFTFAK